MANAANNVDRDYVIDVSKALQTIWKPQSIDLPAFADEQNSKLHEDIKDYSKQINMLISELQEMEAHCTNIENHKNIVLKELSSAQALLDAKQKEVDTEVHLTNLYERDIGRMRQKVVETKNQTREVEDRKQQLQTQLLRQNAKMTELVKEQQALLDEQAEWKLAQQQKAEDQFSIQKYKAIDDKQLQELNQAADRQLKIINQLQAELNTHISDTQTIQIQLDKSAEQFQALQQNRERSIQQFEDAIKILEQREKQQADSEQIRDKLTMEVNLLKQQDREIQQEIDHEEREKQNALHDYAAVEREVQLAQQDYDQTKQEETDLQGEILVNQGQLQNLMRQIAAQGTSLKSLSDQKVARQNALDQVNKRIDLFNAAEDKMRQNKLELDELVATQQKALDGLQEELSKWTSVLNSATADMQNAGKNLNDLKQEEANLKSSISSYQAGLRGLETRIGNMEVQLQQQRRHIYNADFQIQALTRKLSHVRGDISAEEQMVLKKNIEVLQNQLAIETRGIQLVKQQTGSVLAEIGRVKRQLQEARGQKTRIDNNLNELLLSSQTMITAVKRSQDEKEEGLLTLDKLRITRGEIMKDFNKQISILFGLQNRNKQIDLQQQSEGKQLDATRAVLQSDLRLLRDEIHIQRLELRQRRIAESKLECRADVLVAKVAARAKQAQGDPNQEADPRTAQADAIIQFSKKRTDLYQKLAQLKQMEQKAHLEEKGLEQALIALQASNTKVRKMGRPAEAAEKEKLQSSKAQLAQIESQMFYYVNQTRQVMQKLEEINEQNDILREEQDKLAVQYEGVQYGDEDGF